MSSTEVARALVTELVALGVTDVVLSPGSRSAPLAYACADAEAAGWVSTHVRADERTAGFFALGLARATQLTGSLRAVAVVTTSGTAVANLHPAVLEADHAGLPLLVISADRPHEWRGTGASQTTDQPGMFARAVRAETEFPARFNPRAIRGQLTRLVAAALGTRSGDPGPAHLNVGFSEPLVPESRWTPEERPAALAVEPAPRPRPVLVPAGVATLLVAGDGAGPQAAALAEAAGWPLLAEPSSGARLPGAIVHYQRLLADGLAADARRVLVVGHPTLSRSVVRLLGRTDVEIIVVAPSGRWTDVTGTAAAVVGAVDPEPPMADDRAWLARWRAADAAVAAVHQPDQRERAAGAVWATEDWLLVGSSMTVRALDAAAPGLERGARVTANRGLAGIDGLIATGHGMAAGLGAPVRVVLGDLSFQHDLGGLARGTEEPDVDLQLIVLNDGGGAIFGTLEHASAPADLLRRYFTTPQQIDIPAAARALGADGRRVGVADLVAALAEPVRGRSVLDVGLGLSQIGEF
ncbi:MAG: 2-succinyl-5-enolpyruvyl-6-hydroxy-3-cyclohexene-1-carboxylic-acid synthase [Propioniciclava sp.]